MLTKILDYDFNILGMPIDKSGQNNHGQASGIVSTIGADGTKGAGFLSATSRIDVLHNHSWNEITATCIDVRVLLKSLEHRANLVEIERSFALFARTDDVVSFTFYAPEEDPGDPSKPQLPPPVFTPHPSPSGSNDPFTTLEAPTVPNDGSATGSFPPPPFDFTWQGVNTDTEFSPDGQRRTVPLNQYTTISAIHDGIASMRIFINSELAGARYDIKYAVPPLLAPGIVSIGAWPHDERYTLQGSLDFVRVWRHDPSFNYRQFFCRPMSRDAKHYWRKTLRRITENLNDKENAETLMELSVCLFSLQRDLYLAIAHNGEKSLIALERSFGQYMDIWCNNGIDSPQMGDWMRTFLEWMRGMKQANHMINIFPEF